MRSLPFMRRVVSSLVWATAVLLALAGPLGATTADDICPPFDDPCILASAIPADPDSTLDFGSRTFRIVAGGALTWVNNVTIQAAACDFAAGSKLAEDSASSATGFLRLECVTSALGGSLKTIGGGVLIGTLDPNDGPHVISGSIKAKGDSVNVIAVDSAGVPGDITVSGKISAKAKIGTPPGEFRLITNFGNVHVTETARIKLRGATADPFNEIFWVEAGSGSLTIDGKIDLRTKEGAYAVNLEADQAVTFGPKSQIKAKGTTTGAELAINSQSASVTVRGKISAKGKNIQSFNGGLVHICAADDIVVDGGAKIDASDSTSSGDIIVGAGDRVQVGNSEKGALLTVKPEGIIELCGNTTGVTITSNSQIVPDPESVGSNVCTSPESQVIFFLDCNQ